MLTTFQQIYPNNTRTISGLLNTPKQDDVVLLCNTTSAPVQLTLLAPATQNGVGFWSTQYKLYVIDSGNNAAVNNITINAPVGCLVNGLSSFTINTNGATLLLRIVSNTNYIGQYSVIGGGGGFYQTMQLNNVSLPQRQKLNFVGGNVTVTDNGVNNSTDVNILPGFIIPITFITAANLINTDGLLKGAFYNIVDAATSYRVSGGIVLQAVEVNAFSREGKGFFLNADYDGNGSYTTTPVPYVNNLGIWSDDNPITPNIGDVVVWNNNNYINLTGVWYDGSNPPSSDGVNWQGLAPSITNGYISVVDFVIYDVKTNVLWARQDSYGNYVENSTTAVLTLNNPIYTYQWGRAGAYANRITGGSKFQNATNNRGIFNNNTIDSGLFNGAQGYTLNNSVIAFNTISNLGELFIGQKFYGKIEKNVIKGGKLGRLTIEEASSSAQFIGNVVDYADVSIQNLEANVIIAENTFSSSGTFGVVTELKTGSVISGNTITNGALLRFDTAVVVFEKNYISQEKLEYAGTITATINKKTLTNSYSNFELFLDMDDPLVFSAGTLNISFLQMPFGEIYLKNSTGKTINKILMSPSVSTNFTRRYRPDGGSVTFQNTSIATAVQGNLLCDAGNSANLLTSYLLQTDFIEYLTKQPLVNYGHIRTNLVVLS
jgi:hypothetical protein